MTPEEQQKEFIKEYEELCKKHGLELVAAIVPVPTNHGTYELGMQYTVRQIDLRNSQK